MSEIVILSGSPSASSRTDLVLKQLGSKLVAKGFSVVHLSVHDVPQDDLFSGRFDSEAIQKISSQISEAKGVIIGSPVYKAAYSGVLKALIDLLPQDVLQNKPVLPLMTGGSAAHLLALDYTLKPLIATLKGHPLKGIYLIDSQIDKQHPENPVTEDDVRLRLDKQLAYFIELISNQSQSVL